ncbi:HelD family protein [Dactylosporangium matsuzakiense]|uniref:DNA helicase n=1 Tax=Dactylosporangium matsuzakiense TaxID=53360 RepID=A0A9W6KCH0_9ACTN|nr:AAA family ATPase [Dactylosporangium matsuzakiense]GLK98912.1 DNA helicase [Dactylosporangium matsuzakiense]
MPALETELAAERAHLTASRLALKRMREHAEDLFASGDQVAGDPFAAETLGRHLARRIADLADNPDTPLFFGRLDIDEHRYHVGRRHVTDAVGEPMVLDWRAPLSRKFYQASAVDPQDVEVRRRFGFVKGELTSFEDEHLSRGEEQGTSQILLDEIERPRVGPMRDIVATIQPEQDALVRAELDESICVQGAPGTGKTAVGLHRAAYLLYLHRERLRRAGVLIVGPNSAFLQYIASVLPTLGELEVRQSTVEGLLSTPIRSVDSEAAAAVKNQEKLAVVLQERLLAKIARPEAPLQVSDGSYRWRISVEALRRIVDDVRREAPPYGIGRERVRARIVSMLMLQSEARRGDSPSEGWQRRMGKAAPVLEVLDRVWPAVTPEQLVFEVLSDPATDLLDEAEQAAIAWAKPPKTAKSAKWSAADAVLIDEAAGLIDRVPSFGHVVVDEAQDLSPMQARVIARRSEHGSITLLGDLAQGTAPWAARDWRVLLAHLGKPGARVVPLTTGFRVPAAVVALANRLLPALGVDVPEARSLRTDGALTVSTVADIASAVVEKTRAALHHPGSIGVIAADTAVGRLTDALREAGLEDPERIVVLPASLAKGLEYDHVIAVEPSEIVAAEPRGLNRLFVVLTRAVSRLDVLHSHPLPDALQGLS